MLRYSSPNLTSYDLLKSLAVLLMVLDHVGYFIFPGNEWFRIVGRASMPIWLFLIGYARTREVTLPLIAGAIIIFASNFIFGAKIFPTNILFTIMLVRLVLDFATRHTFKNWETAIYGAFIISVLHIFLFMFVEYGTCALLIAMAGYLARHSEKVNLSEKAQRMFMAYSALFYALFELLDFKLPKELAQSMVVCIGAVSVLLYYFRPGDVPEVEEKLPRPVVSLLQFGGRYTLEIYVVHMILLEAIACFYGINNHHWFQWRLAH